MGWMGRYCLSSLLFAAFCWVGCRSTDGEPEQRPRDPEREADCAKLLAFVHQEVDIQRDDVLARGPDDTYLSALGLGQPQHDPRAVAMAKNAGIDLDSSHRRDVAKAKAEFAVNVRRATERLHKRADRFLANMCNALPDEEARCVFDYPAVLSDRNKRLRACAQDDQPCHERIVTSWRAEHPACHQLDERIDVLLNEAPYVPSSDDTPNTR